MTFFNLIFNKKSHYGKFVYKLLFTLYTHIRM